VLRRMVEQLTQRDPSHSPVLRFWGARARDDL